MKFKNSILDVLSKEHTKILVFDCEFWHVFGNKGFIPASSKDFFIPREIGGFFITKSKDGYWNLHKPFFVAFQPPKDKDVSFVSSHFSNVTSKTAKEMDKYQAILEVPWAAAYLNTLPSEMKQLLLDEHKIYLNDPNIKGSLKPVSWLKSFMNEVSESLVIVKGSNDLNALENASRLYKFEFKPPEQYYDIADWNSKSRKICKTARLEGTYNCIKNKLSPELEDLKKILPIGEAHNPISDAAMALIIALYILQIQ